jgi:hypothetical protein
MKRWNNEPMKVGQLPRDNIHYSRKEAPPTLATWARSR